MEGPVALPTEQKLLIETRATHIVCVASLR